MIYADLIAKVTLVTLVTLDKNRSFTILGSNILRKLAFVILLASLLMTTSGIVSLADSYTVSLPIVVNGDRDPLYTSAPMRPFWRLGAVTGMTGDIHGMAIITGLQTIVVRYYENPKNLDVEWHLVQSADVEDSYGKLMRFGTFIFDSDTALILVVPSTWRLFYCEADTLIAKINGRVVGKATFLPPCRDNWIPPGPILSHPALISQQ